MPFFIMSWVYVFPNVLLNAATIFFIQQLTCKKDDRLFYAVALSIAVAQNWRHTGSARYAAVIFLQSFIFSCTNAFYKKPIWNKLAADRHKHGVPVIQ